MTLRLLLVRHGLSSFNLERRIQGRDDLSDLTDTGHDQARRLGASLADVPLDAVYSSRLRRAAATTTSLLEARGGDAPATVFDDGLLEVDLEPWAGMSIDALKQEHSEAYATWKKQPLELELQRAAATTASLLDAHAGQSADAVFDDGLLEVDLGPGPARPSTS